MCSQTSQSLSPSRISPPTREISRRNAGKRGHPAVAGAAGLDRKKRPSRSYYSGFRAARRRYGELCMVSPRDVAPRRAAPGSFPCMPCICWVIDGCVNFIGARYRYRQGYLHRLEDYDTLARSPASRCEGRRVIFPGAINLPPIPTRAARRPGRSSR